ncbi:uncharacterized protein LOC131003008 [Salvia miltiorrhiza]|uniref:uncharacterized protein LOC131003008 n=1 Tax=Salvia miltiorrhiza TaxID=226208 RepID=UPI0025AD42DA|nr:uncharacterized protein LOC131003008 [Salvia miltiorrhiza]
MRRGRPQRNNPNLNDNTGNDAEANVGDGNLIQNLITALQGFVQQQTQVHNLPNNAPAQIQTNQVIEQFRRYAPPRFDGKSGPLALEEWVMELERIFEHIECADAHKVSCATFQFTEDAGHWWRSYKNGMTEAQRQGLTWNRFKEVVMDKYFPRSYRNQKQAEFLDLKQGTMSVTEYERKFNLLARYATRMVNTEDLKADRFLRGLRPEIRGILAGQEIVDYGLAVRRAHEVATGLETDVVPFKAGDNSGKRKFDISNKGKENFPNKKIGEVRPGGAQRPQCPECKKFHAGKCLWNKGVCFNVLSRDILQIHVLKEERMSQELEEMHDCLL